MAHKILRADLVVLEMQGSGCRIQGIIVLYQFETLFIAGTIKVLRGSTRPPATLLHNSSTQELCFSATPTLISALSGCQNPQRPSTRKLLCSVTMQFETGHCHSRSFWASPVSVQQHPTKRAAFRLSEGFTLIAINSRYPGIHELPLNAYRGIFAIGKTATGSCRYYHNIFIPDQTPTVLQSVLTISTCQMNRKCDLYTIEKSIAVELLRLTSISYLPHPSSTVSA